mgnify:CR=1 FL=1
MKNFFIYPLMGALLFGAIGIAIAIATGSTSNELTEYNQVLTIEDVSELENLDIRFPNEDIILTSTDDDFFTILYEGNLRSTVVEQRDKLIELEGDEKSKSIYLQDKNSLWDGFFFWGGTLGSATVTIEVPKEFSQEIVVNSVSGDIFVEDLTLETFTAGSVSGDIEIVSSIFSELIIDTVSGDSDLENTNTEELTIDTTSGDVDATISEDVSELETNIDTTSGDMEFDIPDNVELSVDFDSTSGDLETDIPYLTGGKESFSFIFDSTSGDLTIE